MLGQLFNVVHAICLILDVSLTFEGESSHDANVEKTEAVKLPENLSADILEVINSIKQAALEHKDGKVKFFNEEVNSKLLRYNPPQICMLSSNNNTSLQPWKEMQVPRESLQI